MRSTEDRFWSKVRVGDPNECWPWMAGKVGGYGRFSGPSRRLVLAHRFAFELLRGPIPAGRQLHHVCENPGCVNPSHLNPVKPRQHTVKLSPNSIGYKNARKTHCPKGHPLTGSNVTVKKGKGYTGRGCKQCQRDRYQRNKENNRKAARDRYAATSVNRINTVRIYEAKKRGISMKIIEVTVFPDGSTKVETKGFVGKACQDATRQLEQAMGNTTGEKKKPEFYKAAASGTQQARS